MKTVGPTVPPGVVTLIRAASLCRVNVGETMANMEVMKDIAIVSHETRLAYVLGWMSMKKGIVDLRREEKRKEGNRASLVADSYVW